MGEKGEVTMDILYWIDQLEALLDEGWRIPLTTKIIIDEDECLNIIDQLRVNIPAEIRKAKQIQQDGQKLIAQGQEEAERILALAREQAGRLLDEEDIRLQTEQRVKAIVENAVKEAEQIRQGADEYALETLSELEAHLAALQKTVRNGLAALSRRRGGTEAESREPSE